MSNAKQLQKVALLRGRTQAELLTDDLLPNSVIFDGDFCSKTPKKAAIVSEIETYLYKEDVIFNKASNMRTEVVIDFMSFARQIVVKSDVTFAQIVD